MATGYVILGYGPVGDLCAIKRAREDTGRRKRATITEAKRRYNNPVTERELEHFEHYALILAGQYPHHGSGADGDDVAQTAMVAAWQAIESYEPGGKKSFRGYVCERMRWRVIDFVRIRHKGGQRAFERRTIPLPGES